MSFLRRAVDFVRHPTHTRTMGIVVILVLVSAVSLTVIASQQQQTTKQRASGNDTTCKGNYYANLAACTRDLHNCYGAIDPALDEQSTEYKTLATVCDDQHNSCTKTATDAFNNCLNPTTPCTEYSTRVLDGPEYYRDTCADANGIYSDNCSSLENNANTYDCNSSTNLCQLRAIPCGNGMICKLQNNGQSLCVPLTTETATQTTAPPSAGGTAPAAPAAVCPQGWRSGQTPESNTVCLNDKTLVVWLWNNTTKTWLSYDPSSTANSLTSNQMKTALEAAKLSIAATPAAAPGAPAAPGVPATAPQVPASGELCINKSDVEKLRATFKNSKKDADLQNLNSLARSYNLPDNKCK